jgi:hypothetical protein
MGRSVTLDLLLARARHAGSRWLLVTAGLAAAAVLPVVAQAVTSVTADAALRQGLAALPPGQAAITVSYNGLPDPAEQRTLDQAVRSRLPRLTGGPVHRQLLFREISDGHGGAYSLGAADRLATEVRLVSGRMPATCTPTHCEVVALRLPGEPPLPQVSDLGLVVVGEAVRTDPLLLSGTFDPGPGHPVLLADGVTAASALAPLQLFGRTFGWVAPLDLSRIRSGGVTGWVAQSAAVGDDLWKQVPGLVLTVPDEVLRDEDARAGVSAGRFVVLGGATSVLLLGTAVVGGAALRRDHEAFLGALRRRGVSRRRLAALVGGEVGLAVVAGTLLGLVPATAVAAVLARIDGLPVAPTAWQSLLGGLASVTVLAVAAAVLLAITLTLPAGPAGAAPAGIWRATDAVALGCLVVAGLLAARGGVTTGSAGSGDPLLVMLPSLVLVAAGLLLARIWLPVTRLGQRHLPRRALGARLGLAAAGGRPLRPVATAALVTAAVAAAVFAGAYRSTLQRGALDQAAFAVPTTARLLIGSSLERPLDVAGQRLPGATGYPVVRSAASVRISADQAQAVELVGVDPAVLPRTSRWSAVTGGGDPAEAARRLAVAGVPTGVALPAGRTLQLSTPGTKVTLAVTAQVRAADGRERGVPLRVVPAAGPAAAMLVGDLPQLTDASGRPARLWLVSLIVRQAADQADRRQHALGEGNLDLAAPQGRIRLGALTVLPGTAGTGTSGTGASGTGSSGTGASGGGTAGGGTAGGGTAGGGTAVAAPWRGWSAPGLTVDGAGGQAVLDYRLSTGALLVQARPEGPGSGDVALPVLVDPLTAASGSGGRLTLTLDGTAVTAEVVGVLPRFPTTGGRFAVADLSAVSRLVDLANPGSGQPSELWLAAPDPAAAASVLAGAPFDRLDVRVQSAVAASLQTDPVAGGASGLLLAGALLTLLVAAAAVVLLVVAERYDDAAQAYAWEADGVAPAVLRRALWWRAVAVVVPAVPAGVVAGVALSTLTARLVAVSATAGTPQPPLVSGVGAGWGLAAIAAGLVGALAVAAAVAASSMREPLPVRGRGVAR